MAIGSHWHTAFCSQHCLPSSCSWVGRDYIPLEGWESNCSVCGVRSASDSLRVGSKVVRGKCHYCPSNNLPTHTFRIPLILACLIVLVAAGMEWRSVYLPRGRWDCRRRNTTDRRKENIISHDMYAFQLTPSLLCTSSSKKFWGLHSSYMQIEFG